MTKIKNIVIICDYAYFEGGAANVAMMSVLAFAKYTNLNVYCFAGNGEPCEELKASRAKIINLGMPDLLRNKNKVDAFIRGIYNKRAGIELSKLLATLNREETIVHIHTWTKVLSSSVFQICNEMKFRTYLTIHEYFLACPNGACYNYVDQSICNLRPLSLSCIKCNCDSRNYMQKLWRCLRQVKQNKVIRNFKELNYIFISQYQEQQLLKRLPDIRNRFLVKNPINVGKRMHLHPEACSDYLYIGRLTKEKGPQLFCEAVTKAKVHGVVIGTGILEKDLKEQFPNIEFRGWQTKEEINKQLMKTRALIFPSLWYEGSPLTTPEVQAHGIPCIVTDCSSATDDIVSGKNGEIVRANIDEIVDAISRLNNDKYISKLSKNAYDMFDEKRGSEQIYVANLMKIYNENR